MAAGSVDEVHIEANSADPRELETRDELRGLLTTRDLSGLLWTDRVLVEKWAVPHSHPILTLNTRHAGDDLLSTFLHEQLHWWTDGCLNWSHAVDATQESWPTVPDATHGGAKTSGPPGSTSSSATSSIRPCSP